MTKPADKARNPKTLLVAVSVAIILVGVLELFASVLGGILVIGIGAVCLIATLRKDPSTGAVAAERPLPAGKHAATEDDAQGR
ncbi:MAG: hypothetical protein PHR15_03325 [Atopobiaceae bacterium]|jgi:hypothetical protein|nr:hypothetical protein [Atopobiaceae bacterium]MCH4180256.1 hypothetical protein [Atopobiaceae bacterium]MCH4214742.1 hypothetical protein [Atopobiaceae bacterium]MCH4229143.1 hypothetical protein [Atopobiaceae bacterium]MCH4276514.1 hypothetical protein [Atopobiaceae bacterium]